MVCFRGRRQRRIVRAKRIGSADWRVGVYDQVASSAVAGRVVLSLLVLVMLWAVQQIDVLGMGTALSRNSHAVASRALAPWYPSAASEAVAVVLFPRPWERGNASSVAERDRWPPTREDILNVVEHIVHQCPKAVVVDLFFDSDRGAGEQDFPELLAKLLATRTEARCPYPPALIFADDGIQRRPVPSSLQALVQGRWEHAHTTSALELIRQRQAHQKASFQAFLDGTEPPAPPDLIPFVGPGRLGGDEGGISDGLCVPDQIIAAKEGTASTSERRVALAVASWPAEDERHGADQAYRGRSSEEFYFLLGFQNTPAAAGAPSGSTSLDEDGTWDRATGRASVALAAYFAYCERGGNCATRGGDSVYEAARIYWSGEQSHCALAEKHQYFFNAPLDPLWPRWSPPGNLSFVSYDETENEDRASVDDCHPLTNPGAHTRAWASLWSMIGQMPGATSKLDAWSRARCYPFVTLTDEQVLLAPKRVDGAGQRAVRATAQHQALAGDVARALTHKVVFVGLSDLTSGPTVQSPVHGRLPGVFTHAVAFDNLVHWRDAYMRPPSNATEVLGAPLGRDALVELLASGLLVTVLVAVSSLARRSRVARRLWCALYYPSRHRRLGSIGASMRYLKSVCIDVSVLLAVSLSAFLSSLVITILFYLFFNWSIMNWIGVSVAALSTFLFLWQAGASNPRLILKQRGQ